MYCVQSETCRHKKEMCWNLELASVFHPIFPFYSFTKDINVKSCCKTLAYGLVSGLWTHNLLHSSPEPLTEQTLKHSTKWCFTVFILVCVLFGHLATGWRCSKKVIPFQRQWKPLYHTAILLHSCWEERKSKEITFINTWLKMASLSLFLQTNQVSFEGCYCTGGVQKR